MGIHNIRRYHKTLSVDVVAPGKVQQDWVFQECEILLLLALPNRHYSSNSSFGRSPESLQSLYSNIDLGFIRYSLAASESTLSDLKYVGGPVAIFISQFSVWVLCRIEYCNDLRQYEVQ